MSKLEIIAQKLVYTMVCDGKITENESKTLLRFLLNKKISNIITKTQDEELIAEELLNLINQIPMRIVISAYSTQDDLSSPLDTFLVTKKRESVRIPPRNNNPICLMKIDS